MQQVDTIYALSTPAGGAIAVIRLSGPLCGSVVEALIKKHTLPAPRQFLPTALFFQGEKLDDAMAVYFAAPRSYTGEDMLELHCHGSPAVLRAVFAALGALGLREAEPGEFTRRAFLNGKLDLSQAEAVMDLIESEATLSARAALMQLQGRLGEDIASVEQSITAALSALGAAMDYPDELEEDVYAELPAQIGEALLLLRRLIKQGDSGRVLREGLRVVLLGAPNAGKSSLLNALLGWERAIVTPMPGTTRDTLEERVLLAGIPVLLLDTAGLHEALDIAEEEGIRRAREAAEQADMIVLLFDGAAALTDDAKQLLLDTMGSNRLLLRTKADLPSAWEDDSLAPRGENERVLPVSVRNGEQGIAPLREAIAAYAGPVGDVYVTNRRHITAMRVAEAALAQAQALLQEDAERNADSISTDLRDALSALGAITGKDVDERVIDGIFERFCVGK